MRLWSQMAPKARRSRLPDYVGMGITASAVSNDPYAGGPFDVLTVNPVEALQG